MGGKDEIDAYKFIKHEVLLEVEGEDHAPKPPMDLVLAAIKAIINNPQDDELIELVHKVSEAHELEVESVQGIKDRLHNYLEPHGKHVSVAGSSAALLQDLFAYHGIR
jgi:hypothetical protein